MTIDVRTVRPEEYTAYIEAVSTAFLDRPDVEKLVRLVTPGWDPGRTWAAFDGERVCGTFRSWATEITVPGGVTLPASAIAGVTVLPTHRRRGILSAMAAAEHAAIRERGEIVGLLYASEYPIYGRFGYGPGCRVATWTLSASRTSFHGEPATGIELMRGRRRGHRDDQGRVRCVAGPAAGRDPPPRFRWEDDLGLRENGFGPTWRGFLAIHRGADRPARRLRPLSGRGEVGRPAAGRRRHRRRAARADRGRERRAVAVPRRDRPRDHASAPKAAARRTVCRGC